MGFIENEMVDVSAKRFHIGQYYENLGYEIPKIQYKGYTAKRAGRDWGYDSKYIFKVKSSEVWKYSRNIITYLCDNCNNPIIMPRYRLETQNHDGKYYCYKCGIKLFITGDNHCNWNPNKTNEERYNQRRYHEYNQFIKRVMARDNYTCQYCGKYLDHDGIIHHLDSYDWCVEKRTDDTNGITLCENCHKNFHSLYGFGNNTKEQFKKWFGCSFNELRKYDGELPTQKQVYCVEDNLLYNSVKEISNILNTSENTIYSACLNHYRFLGKHYLYYNEYLSMSNNEIELLKSSKPLYRKDKRVIRLNDFKIFNSTVEAAKSINVHYSTIIKSCKYYKMLTQHELNYSPIIFMYYYDYQNLDDNFKNNIIENYRKDHGFICLNTGIMYFNVKKASIDVGLKNESRIASCLKHNNNTSGRHPITKEPLKWMKYVEFINLSNDKKEKIINIYKESFIKDSFLFNYIKEN